MVIDSPKLLFKNSPCEMMHKTNVIYKLEHLKSGKIYIGKTVRELRTRISEHIYNNYNYRIDNAIQKYGIGSFDIDVIAEADTEEELLALEKFFIEFYGCKSPNGYNLTDGGEGISGYIFPEEVVQKIAEQNRGRKLSEKTRINMSEAHKGHPVSKKTRIKLSIANTGKSYHVSDETRKKLSETRPNKRFVICIETGEIFKSLAEAAKWAGISDSFMCKICKGEKATGGGYHWKYADEEYNFVEKPPKECTKEIICTETNQIFKSAKEAAEWAGVSETSIRNACRGKSHTSGGYHWAYTDKTHTPNKKKVICIETGKVFETIRDAAKWAGVNEKGIGDACRGKYITFGGYHWKFEDGSSPEIEREPKKPRKKRVICVETNEIFEKMKDAAKWAGVTRKAICRACVNENYTAKGYHWKFADEEN